jgi:hypothetical protein
MFQEVVSGGRANRPVLKQLLDTLRAGDVLVIWKLDRLGRSLKHLGASLVKIFMWPPDGNIAEVRLIVLDNALDCPQGSLCTGKPLFAPYAHSERHCSEYRSYQRSRFIIGLPVSRSIELESLIDFAITKTFSRDCLFCSKHRSG